MNGTLHLLLLAGTAEARRLGDALATLPLRARAVITEPPRGRAPMRIGQELRRFEGGCDLARFISEARFDAVLDASHGFDGQVTRMGFDAARRLGLPHLRLARRIWDAGENRRWRAARDIAAAMAMIGAGTCVFSATGWDSLPAYAEFPGARLLMRQTRTETRRAPFGFVEPVFGVPPFTVESEMRLFESRGVDVLICRNLGGTASRPKLDAAARLGLKVILIDPPATPEGMVTVQDVDAALDWVRGL